VHAGFCGSTSERIGTGARSLGCGASDDDGAGGSADPCTGVAVSSRRGAHVTELVTPTAPVMMARIASARDRSVIDDQRTPIISPASSS
jgi:hypothetical protein